MSEELSESVESNRPLSPRNLQTLTNNVDANELDQEITEKLKGDAIGDTLYSQSFVLKTLLKFSDLMWNEQVEEDLCFLWDMTAEKSVCEFLWEVSFPTIACSAVSKYTENRFIEIVIGTLANVLCSGCERTMTEDEISIILNELDTDDHLILIQVMRFISAVAYISANASFVNEEVMDKLCFILNNSINSELLLKTLETTTKLTVDFKLNEKLINYKLFRAVMTSYHTIFPNNSDYFELDTKDNLLACRYMLENVTNICSYIDNFKNDHLKSEITEISSIVLTEAKKIIRYFSHEENLMPVTEDVVFFMCAFRYILVHLNVDYVPEIFISLSKMLCIISDSRKEVVELFEAALELECFFISRSTSHKILKDLRILSKHTAETVLNIVSENEQLFKFSFRWKDLYKII